MIKPINSLEILPWYGERDGLERVVNKQWGANKKCKSLNEHFLSSKYL